jgi:hypothetical protein
MVCGEFVEKFWTSNLFSGSLDNTNPAYDFCKRFLGRKKFEEAIKCWI